MRCYVSSDLLNWSNSGLVFSVTSEGQHPEVADAGILDRPKVIFNPATRKFVMYFKLYPPKAAGGMKGTEVAYVGVATASEPLGPFEYQGKFTGPAALRVRETSPFFRMKTGRSITSPCANRTRRWFAGDCPKTDCGPPETTR